MTTTEEKRRSDRLMVTIPLLVKGVDARGKAFQAPARTVVLNRHGAQVQIPRSLRAGQTVRLVNLLSRREADFRVAGSVSESTENGGDYRVECLDTHENVWQIQFPSQGEGGTGGAKALLECRMCHALALAGLSPGEVDVLRTAGVVAKRCEGCKAVTPFRYAEISVAQQEPADESWVSAPVELATRRERRRVHIQLPLRVRDEDGSVEITKTENTSRSGLCFTSDRDYQANQAVRLVFPGEATSGDVEIPARIVRRQLLEGTNRKIYGARYEEKRNRRQTDQYL